jgi:hypothetical protein
LLDEVTVVEDYSRRFRNAATVRRLEDDERGVVEAALRAYLDTIAGSKRLRSPTYEFARAFFAREGIARPCRSQTALQAHADLWLGWTRMEGWPA